ncbi:MAG: hypothetical protein ACO3EZ_19895, partial [Prochlorotrichaceae cyanobacterium]
MRNITIAPSIPAAVPDESLFPVTLLSPPSYWTEANKSAIAAQVTAENEGVAWDFVPEPPPPLPEPDWISFNTAMLSDSNWQAWALPADLRNAMIAASINSNLTSLENAYAIAKAAVPPSAEAITGWQGL